MFVPGKPLQPSPKLACKPNLPEPSTFSGAPLLVRLMLLPLDKAVKTCQGQTCKLITNISIHRKFYNIGPWWQFPKPCKNSTFFHSLATSTINGISPICCHHRYLKKSRLRPLLVLPLPRAFLQQPLTVLTIKTRQAIRAINQSIFLRCLWLASHPRSSLKDSLEHRYWKSPKIDCFRFVMCLLLAPVLIGFLFCCRH